MSKEKKTINLNAWVKSISSCESAYIPGVRAEQGLTEEEMKRHASGYCLLTIATESARNDEYDKYHQTIHVVVRKGDAPFWSQHLHEGSLTLSLTPVFSSAPVKPSKEE